MILGRRAAGIGLVPHGWKGPLPKGSGGRPGTEVDMSYRMLLPLAILLASPLAGCSSDHATTAPSRSTLSVVPADGAVGVRLDAPVAIEFPTPVDRAVVERSFHLMSEASMNDTLCSADPSMVGDMTEMMGDEGMMGHMLESHSVAGQFEWNGATSCVFRPGEPMTAQTRYMIYLGSEVMQMMDDGMSMTGNGGTMMDGAMAHHFTTLDPASHESHHGAVAPGGER